MQRAAALLLLGLAACGAPRLGTSRGGAHIFAPPEDVARLRSIVEQYEPRVIDELGSRWPYSYAIEVRDIGPRVQGVADDDSKRVCLSPSAVDDHERTPEVLVHELVHVHAIGHWTELPYALQEGLAFWLSLSLVQNVKVYSGPPPDPENLWRALTITADEYQSSDDTRGVDQAATWLASRLFEVTP